MEHPASQSKFGLACSVDLDTGGAGTQEMRAIDAAIACPEAKTSAAPGDETYVHTLDMHAPGHHARLRAEIGAAEERAPAQAEANHAAMDVTENAGREAQFDASAVPQKYDRRAGAAMLARGGAERDLAVLAATRARAEFELAVQARKRADSERDALHAIQQRLLAETHGRHAHEVQVAAERASAMKFAQAQEAAARAARLRGIEGEHLLHVEQNRAAAEADALAAAEAARAAQEEAAAAARERTGAQLQLKTRANAARKAECAASEQARAAQRLAAEAEHAATARHAAEAAAMRAWKAQSQQDRGFAVAAAADAHRAALQSSPRGLRRWLVMLRMYAPGGAAVFGTVLIAAVMMGAMARVVVAPGISEMSQVQSPGRVSLVVGAAPCAACGGEDEGPRLKLATALAHAGER